MRLERLRPAPAFAIFNHIALVMCGERLDVEDAFHRPRQLKMIGRSLAQVSNVLAAVNLRHVLRFIRRRNRNHMRA